MSAEHHLTDRDPELLSTYLDGALSSQERAALEVRLAAEPALRRELATLRQTVALIHDLPRTRAPRDFTLTRSVVRPPRVLIFPATTAVSALSAVAAIILVVAGVALMARTNREQLSGAVGNTVSQSVAVAPTQTTPPAEAPTTLLSEEARDLTENRLDDEGQSGAANAQPGLMADQLAAPTQIAPSAPGFAAGALPTQSEQAQTAFDGDDGLAADSAVGPPVGRVFTQTTEPFPLALMAPPGDSTEPEAMLEFAAPAASSGEGASGGSAPSKAVAQEPTATETPTATATATATATVTPSPTPTDTPLPSATPTLIPSPTASPTPAPLLQLPTNATDAAGIILIAAGIVALAIALLAFVNRRRA